MTRLVITGVLLALCSSYLTLAVVSVETARDVGLLYAVVVGTVSLLLSAGRHGA